MKLISREELKEKIEREDDFKLVFVLGEWQYRAKHIPGSLHIDTPEKGLASLKKEDDIVVYCSNPKCAASQYAYKLLDANGYQHIRRYAGGIQDWEEAGYPLEGEMV
ncbi:MAG: rhodanese-like domain-containing protein [Anaerolineales bacterium]